MVSFVTALRQRIAGQWREPGYEIDPTGFRQGALERMISDGLLAAEAEGGAGVEWVRTQTTLTYPAGNNGWVLVEEFSPATALHVENTSEIPATDAALVHQFTVTEAMLAIGNLDQVNAPTQTGLALSLATTMDAAANPTFRRAVEVNGTQVFYDSTQVASSRKRVGWGVIVPCEVGDVVKLHMWTTTAQNATVVLLVAAPFVLLGSLRDTPGRQMMMFSPTVGQGNEFLSTGPAAVTSDVGGSTAAAAYQLIGYQRGPTPGETNTTFAQSHYYGIWTLASEHPRHMALYTLTLQYAIQNSDVGDPLLHRLARYTSLDFWYAEFDNSTLPGFGAAE